MEPLFLALIAWHSFGMLCLCAFVFLLGLGYFIQGDMVNPIVKIIVMGTLGVAAGLCLLFGI